MASPTRKKMSSKQNNNNRVGGVQSSASSTTSSSQTQQRRSLLDFERRLTETDAYLQLVINQVKTINAKIEESPLQEDKEKLVDIKVKTLTLLDAIKQTIVLLQIAKVRGNLETLALWC